MRYDLPCYKMSVYPGIRSTSQSQLSQFLKSRRARISPTTLGLPNGRRRRTPGLRREEVAELAVQAFADAEDRKSTRLNSSHANTSYAVFCLKKKKTR